MNDLAIFHYHLVQLHIIKITLVSQGDTLGLMNHLHHIYKVEDLSLQNLSKMALWKQVEYVQLKMNRKNNVMVQGQAWQVCREHIYKTIDDQNGLNQRDLLSQIMHIYQVRQKIARHQTLSLTERDNFKRCVAYGALPHHRGKRHD